MEASSTTIGLAGIAPPILDGSNYHVWQVRMKAFLEGADLWEAVEDDYVVPPLVANPTANQQKLYKERVTRKAKARSSLYAAVTPIIFNRIMSLESAKDIWDFLKKEYEGNKKIKGMKAMNLKRELERVQMKENESVQEFADKLLDLTNKLALLGTDLGEERLVEKLLCSVPERFEATIASLENTREISEMPFAEAVSALQAQEQRRVLRRGDEPVEGAMQARVKHGSGEKKKQGKQFGAQQTSFSSSDAQVRKGSDEACKHCGKKGHPFFRCWRRPNVVCRKCGKMGHIERICKEKSSQQGEAQPAAGEVEQLFVASGFVSQVSRDGWLVDSGCSNHMSGNEAIFTNIDRSVNTRVRIGNGDHLEVEGRGNVLLEGPGGVKLMSDVYYVPKIDQNLLSVGQLVEKGMKIVFDKNECAIADEEGKLLFRIPMQNKTFAFDPASKESKAMACVQGQEELWHRRLGHFHYKGLQFMQRHGLVEDLPQLGSEVSDCEVCLQGKLVRKPFQKTRWRAKEKLQLVHSDVCGPMPEESLNKSKYFVTFIDDCTRFCWVYFLKQKSEVDEVFLRFKQEVENEANCKIKTVRSDNGGEYTSKRFKAICENSGIKQQFTVPYTPQQNGVSERKNRSIVEMGRCMLQGKQLPKSFWAEAVNTAVFLLNRLPTKALNKQTSFEAWHGYKPKVSGLRTFGCLCYYLTPSVSRDKLDHRGEAGIFVGYSSQSKAYRVYCPDAQKITMSRDVIFCEDKNWERAVFEKKMADNIVVEANVQNEDELNEEADLQNECELIEDELIDSLPMRGTRPLAEVYARCNVALLEPGTVEEAKGSVEWASAMKEELSMINKNNTWQLVSKPDHKKTIGVKWVFKTKLNPNGTVNKYKARLVVKGYAQVSGVDYSETFAPVARMDTIRLLLAVAAQKRWTIYQLDVKSAFLNGDLSEDIYVDQPEGFVVKGHEDKVYKLRKALYGLKQAPRAWYSKIDCYLHQLGFQKSLSEVTLYYKQSERGLVVVSIYVDDLLVTGEKESEIVKLKVGLMKQFEMTDLGRMSYFLGMEIQQKEGEIFICQRKYIREVLKRFEMGECKTVTTPVNQKEKLSKSNVQDSEHENEYRSLVGCLMYLTATRPDIQYAVSILSRFLHCAAKEHLTAAKRVLRYLKGTQSYGVKFKAVPEMKLVGFVDSDWGGSVEDMKSTTGFCFSLGSGCFSWSSKKQEVVAQSTAEAEFVAATAAAKHAVWLRKLLCDLGLQEKRSTVLYVDNQAAIAIAQNPVFHGKTKHFKLRFYYLREAQQEEEVELKYCKTDNQIADVFTKPLAVSRFSQLIHEVGMCPGL